MTAPPRVIIVADDLTGAMDVAGPLAARGLNTLAVASLDGCTPQHLAGAEVVSINADSRHLSGQAAADRVRTILRGLVHPDAEILIKKIDSTLRGPIGADPLLGQIGFTRFALRRAEAARVLVEAAPVGRN